MNFSKKITHIIYISYLPLTQKFKDDFYVERLKREGFSVEYWDLTKIFNAHLNLEKLPDEIVQPVDTYKSLERKIIAYRDFALFIFNITYSARVYKLFRLFSKHKCLTASFARGALPSPTYNFSIIKRFFVKFKALGNKKYVKATILNQLAILAKRFNLVKPYNFIFYAGNSGVYTIGYGYKFGLAESKLIPVNSFDYDAYLLLKEKNCKPMQERYCVFLDGYLPFHPDFKMMHLPQLEPQKYYTSLNSFFSLVENTYNIKVVIAAHPKSSYNSKNPYGNRMVLKNKTAELVQHAEFVLAHVSTSISYAVLFKKSLAIIYTTQMKDIYRFTQYPVIIYFSNLLKASCINVDEEFRVNILPVNEHAYIQYKYNFLTNPQSEHELSENIFMNTLKDMQPKFREPVAEET